ncbi:hypothetical protein QR98_0037960 [Sarcoptes scabiei]|uniref:Uncharacterized protein n=1 Tax=Sarcoptes scabiei TaxID=52283 RepID=A0A132A3Y7_SARSC|nr:hypothetical protein QR98_0037960 [Sarcoptes scabiei]
MTTKNRNKTWDGKFSLFSKKKKRSKTK